MRRLTLLLALWALPASAATYYVKTTGNDSAAGTSSGAAWQTLRKACRTAGANDTIIFSPGTYQFASDTCLHADGTAWPFIIPKSGQTWRGDGTGQVVWDVNNTGYRAIFTAFKYTGTSNVTFDGVIPDGLKIINATRYQSYSNRLGVIEEQGTNSPSQIAIGNSYKNIYLDLTNWPEDGLSTSTALGMLINGTRKPYLDHIRIVGPWDFGIWLAFNGGDLTGGTLSNITLTGTANSATCPNCNQRALMLEGVGQTPGQPQSNQHWNIYNLNITMATNTGGYRFGIYFRECGAKFNVWNVHAFNVKNGVFKQQQLCGQYCPKETFNLFNSTFEQGNTVQGDTYGIYGDPCISMSIKNVIFRNFSMAYLSGSNLSCSSTSAQDANAVVPWLNNVTYKSSAGQCGTSSTYQTVQRTGSGSNCSTDYLDFSPASPPVADMPTGNANIVVNPALDSSGYLTSTSGAINVGVSDPIGLGCTVADDAGRTANYCLDVLGTARPQGGAWDAGWYERPAGGDITPPVISNISAAPSTTTATITWTTDETATSRVDYGLTSAYGSVATDGSFVLSHSVGLSGLTCNPATTYHYKVTSADGSGNSASSTDRTFATVSCAPDPLTIINRSGGAWSPN